MSGSHHSDGNAIFDRLASRLKKPLPGKQAHEIAWPATLPARALPSEQTYRKAAVLLALVPDASGFFIPLVERPASMPHHPGQVGLPGGGRDEGETAEDCALREAEEEIGLARSSVRILGRLSPVSIPVSGFRVEVFVGGVRDPIALTPQNREVARLLRGRPEIWREGPDTRYVRERDGQEWTVPAYALEGTQVWGATALMLAEFLWIWRDIQPGKPERSGRF